MLRRVAESQAVRVGADPVHRLFVLGWLADLARRHDMESAAWPLERSLELLVSQVHDPEQMKATRDELVALLIRLGCHAERVRVVFLCDKWLVRLKADGFIVVRGPKGEHWLSRWSYVVGGHISWTRVAPDRLP